MLLPRRRDNLWAKVIIMQGKETQNGLDLLGDNLKTEKASWNGQEIPSCLGVGRERGLVHKGGRGRVQK